MALLYPLPSLLLQVYTLTRTLSQAVPVARSPCPSITSNFGSSYGIPSSVPYSYPQSLTISPTHGIPTSVPYLDSLPRQPTLVPEAFFLPSRTCTPKTTRPPPRLDVATAPKSPAVNSIFYSCPISQTHLRLLLLQLSLAASSTRRWRATVSLRAWIIYRRRISPPFHIQSRVEFSTLRSREVVVRQ